MIQISMFNRPGKNPLRLIIDLNVNVNLVQHQAAAEIQELANDLARESAELRAATDAAQPPTQEN